MVEVLFRQKSRMKRRNPHSGEKRRFRQITPFQTCLPKAIQLRPSQDEIPNSLKKGSFGFKTKRAIETT